mmetsp:Transcript_12497/g.28832  ORF Transcript_12497/g.28832 Transcript_12497/m.28832 type:complete len:289 (+) Transcript_12497:94-960(+)
MIVFVPAMPLVGCHQTVDPGSTFSPGCAHRPVQLLRKGNHCGVTAAAAARALMRSTASATACLSHYGCKTWARDMRPHLARISPLPRLYLALPSCLSASRSRRISASSSLVSSPPCFLEEDSVPGAATDGGAAAAGGAAAGATGASLALPPCRLSLPSRSTPSAAPSSPLSSASIDLKKCVVSEAPRRSASSGSVGRLIAVADDLTCSNQRCLRTSAAEGLALGSTVSIQLTSCAAASPRRGGTGWLGTPLRMRRTSELTSSASKGSAEASRAYKMTPHDHRSDLLAS